MKIKSSSLIFGVCSRSGDNDVGLPFRPDGAFFTAKNPCRADTAENAQSENGVAPCAVPIMRICTFLSAYSYFPFFPHALNWWSWHRFAQPCPYNPCDAPGGGRGRGGGGPVDKAVNMT